jgi:hypothetical protein
MTQGRVEYESTVPWGTDEGLDLWEADETDDSILWNDSEEDGYVRSVCDDKGTDWEDGNIYTDW